MKNLNNFLDNYDVKSDKCSFLVPFDKCSIPIDFDYEQKITGLKVQKNTNGLKVDVSGKIFSTSTDLGLITAENYTQIPEAVYNLSGIEIDKNYTVNMAVLCRFDATQDIFVDGHPQYYISELREILKRSSDKYSVYKHKNTTYDNGLSIKPKKSNIHITYDIYVKGPEMKRYRDYYKQFDHSFLLKTNNIIRCEYQIANQACMRKEFGIENNVKPTMALAFACKRNVVADMLNNLLNGGFVEL